MYFCSVKQKVIPSNEPESQDAKTKVLFVGRLVDWKVVDILIDVFSNISDQSIHLNIVGDGSEMAALQTKAKALGNVTFHGWVEHSELNSFYDAADIFVLPSVRECGGAVILEAMARGVPAIATRWGGPVDYIADGTGLLVEPLARDYMVNEFKKHIEDLALDKEKRRAIGKKALEHIAQNFLWESKVKTMIEIYQEVVL